MQRQTKGIADTLGACRPDDVCWRLSDRTRVKHTIECSKPCEETAIAVKKYNQYEGALGDIQF
eukprot:scaffold998_cov411-Prasinococcus_capsulatus_cf.AAC.5